MNKEKTRYVEEWDSWPSQKDLLYDNVKALYKTVISCGGDGWGVFVCKYANPDEVIEIIKELDYIFKENTDKPKDAWRFIGENQQGIFVITKDQFLKEPERVIQHAVSGLVML